MMFRKIILWNLEYNQTLSGTAKKLGKALVFLFETLSRPFVDHFIFLPKVCFTEEMPALKNHTVIENKAYLPEKTFTCFQIETKPSPPILIDRYDQQGIRCICCIDWFIRLREILPESQPPNYRTLPPCFLCCSTQSKSRNGDQYNTKSFPYPFASFPNPSWNPGCRCIAAALYAAAQYQK